MRDQNVNHQGIFGEIGNSKMVSIHPGNLSTDVNAEGQALLSPGLTLDSQMPEGIAQS